MAAGGLCSWSLNRVWRAEPSAFAASSLFCNVVVPGRLNPCRSVHKKTFSVQSSTTEEPTADGTPTAAASGEATGSRGQNGAVVNYAGKSITVRQGMKLRTALLRHGASPHNGNSKIINCRGLGTCGTCAVRIQGQVAPPEWTTAEQLRLNFVPHGEPTNRHLRLACQVRVMGDITVTKMSGFWGQGSEGALHQDLVGRQMAPPFGELEFVLDKDSKL